MTDYIISMFIKDYENVNDPKVRESYGKLGSMIGIITNIFLSFSKITIGILFNSIAITADGVNNLSDIGSSVITLVGFKISGKPADKEHPFGHARLEYIAGFIVGIIILLLSFELIKASVDKIINPKTTVYSIIMIFVLIFSITVKLWLSHFNNNIANRIMSTTLKAAAMDSKNDVIATTAILISVLIYKITDFEVDGYMGILIALFILKSGISILKEIMNPILGELPDENFIRTIENKILSYNGILNIHDLVVHNYGPSKYFVTVHVEVDAKENILKSHDIIDNIERDFAKDLNINLVIHLDPIVTDDNAATKLKIMTEKIIYKIDKSLSIHDFRIVNGKTHINLIFDVVLPVDYSLNSDEVVNKIKSSVKEENDMYFAVITIDRNYISSYINEPFLN